MLSVALEFAETTREAGQESGHEQIDQPLETKAIASVMIVAVARNRINGLH